MWDWGEMISFSILGSRSVEMVITLTGMLSEDQKMSIAKDKSAKFFKYGITIVHFCCFLIF